MPANNRIPVIRLSEERQKELASRIEEMVSDCEEYRGTWMEMKDEGLRAYRCIPDQETKSFPWPGAHNIFLPLTRVIVDGYMAQEWDAMFSNDPFIGVRPVESGDVHSAELIERFYDWVYREVIPFRNIANDFLFDSSLDGTAAIKPRWNRDKSLIRRQYIEQTPIYESVKTEIMGVETQAEVQTGMENNWVEAVELRRAEQPVIDNVDLSRILIPPHATDSFQYETCPYYIQEQWLTKEALICRRNEGYENIDEGLFAAMGEAELTDLERTNREDEGLAQKGHSDTARVLEVYMRLPLGCEYEVVEGGSRTRKTQTGNDDDDYAEEVIVTYLYDTGKISRIVPLGRLRGDYKRPHIQMKFSRVPRMWYGMGLAAKMRQLNRWMNSNVNQMMDFGTLVNIPFFFYSPALTGGLLPDMAGLRPGAGIPVQDPRAINYPRFTSRNEFWLQALNLGQLWAERDGGINDINMGRQPSLPNAPKTARGQGMMLAQANLAFGRAVSLHKEPFEEIFRRVHQDYVRWGPDEIAFRVLNENGVSFKSMRMSKEILRQEMDFEFKLNPNRTAEQQANQQLYQLILQALPLAATNPVLAGPIRGASKQLYESLGKKNFDEFWPEDLAYQIQAQAQQAQQQQMMMQQQEMAAKQGQGGPPMMPQPQPGMGGQVPMMPGVQKMPQDPFSGLSELLAGATGGNGGETPSPDEESQNVRLN